MVLLAELPGTTDALRLEVLVAGGLQCFSMARSTFRVHACIN